LGTTMVPFRLARGRGDLGCGDVSGIAKLGDDVGLLVDVDL